LCLTQIVSWGVLYYAFPVALAAIAADTGWSETVATAAFSTGLLVSAVAGIPVGRLLDRHGPRPVMTGGSVVAGPALILIALAPNPVVFFAGWILAGLAMAAVFYPAAFAALTRWYGPDRVRALTVLTLAGGLASTLFAPVTALLLEQHSWRVTYLILAAALAVLTIPAHALLLTPRWTPDPGTRVARADPGVGTVVRSGGFLLLCARLTLTGFALHAAGLALIPLLTGRGLSPALAALGLGLLGAGQLLGRVGYGPLSTRTTPTSRTGIVLAAAAAGLLTLAVVPGPSAALIGAAVLVGAARGAVTLLQASLVADRWGTTHYAVVAGVLAAPVTIAGAVAPWASTVLAAGFGGSYPALFVVLAVLIGVAAAAGRIRTDQAGAATGADPDRSRAPRPGPAVRPGR
jgi:MFS family permease